MRSVEPVRSCRPRAGALLAFLAWSALAPGLARAGCVHGLTSTSEPAAHFDHLARTGALPLPADRDDQPGPCPGGICSRNPSPPAAPVLVPTTPVESWACLAAGFLMPRPGPIASTFDEAVVLPIRPGPAIFHPPRLRALPSTR